MTEVSVGTGPVVVVVNPTKFDDLAEVRQEVSRVATERGQEIRLVETTEDDPGFGQTRDAVDAGASVVCALGGDGTVRAVAEVLVGTGVPLGLLPGGTGNLLARNLELPMSSITDALDVVLTGTDRVIDVGWLEVDPADDEADAGDRPDRSCDDVHVFTVMAGIGFDAQIMDDAPEAVKAKVGWAAYVAAAAKHLGDNGFRVTVTPDDGEPMDREARTVIVGNCGTLTGGIVLLPDAVIDDGRLDLAVLTPESLTQWLGVAGRVLTGRSPDGPSIERTQCRRVDVTVEPAQQIEVDGDVMGTATRLRFSIEQDALVVRVPAGQVPQ
jgi:diacylglycerol kinase (ATP)